MPKRVAVSTLNASTIDILNTIRANASLEYQNQVPEVTVDTDIPKVGEVLYGYPALANQFINALVNRIALVRVKSAVFNNAYKELKKGYLEYGETVEEVFVNIAKVREYSAEKAAARELKRTLPDVKSAFHVLNWRVQYPVTIQDQDLRQAFLSAEGVQDLIARIVDSVYTAAEYDEFLLFKYLIIKAVAHGKMFPVSVGAELTDSAVEFRAISNMLTFMSTKYNEAGVLTTTPKRDQYIFMDATFNAKYDVNVLAAAFNMDKADFMGRLFLIDDFTSFDMERFETIMAGSDMLEPITAEELALMADVQAVMVDGEWFQVYDNNNKFTETYVAAGMYWNYFYNTWKTISHSPFSNAVAFVASTADVALPDTINFTVMSKSESPEGTVITMIPANGATLASTSYKFVQTEEATANLIAVHPYGAIIIPGSAAGQSIALEITVDGVTYTAASAAVDALTVDESLTFTKG